MYDGGFQSVLFRRIRTAISVVHYSMKKALLFIWDSQSKCFHSRVFMLAWSISSWPVSKMKFVTYQNLLKFVASATCLGIFVALFVEQCNTFMEEPTGSSLTRESVEDIPFPAITICDMHIQNALAYEELNFPRSPFASGPLREVLSNPEHLIEKLTLFGHEVVPNLWRYFFTLDKIIHNLVALAGEESTPDNKCKVGNVNCVRKMTDIDVVIPSNSSHQEVEIDVQAGKWKSKFYASSVDSSLYLCHTLVPNVSVDFSNTGGNVLSLVWKSNYVRTSIYRRIYIHDRNEDVLLNSFAIETVASIIIEQRVSYDNASTEGKKKLQIIPKLVKHPKHSSVHPCKQEQNYSENRCNVQWGWHNKINIMREYYGSNFTCVPPGVWDMSEVDPMPVCHHYEARLSNNYTLGYSNVIKEPNLSLKNKNRPLMAGPPLGIYKSTSPCVRRCQLYTYTILEEPMSAYDTDISDSDIYIFFASPVVETWAEYPLMTTLDLHGFPCGWECGFALGNVAPLYNLVGLGACPPWLQRRYFSKFNC